MGQTVTVRCTPDLPAALASLAAARMPCSVVMLDGQLVMPTAALPAAWQEVRLKTPAGMVTLRKAADQVTVLVFGNAAPDLLEMRDRIAAAFAARLPAAAPVVSV